MGFPTTELHEGANAWREFTGWCLEGQPATNRDVLIRQRMFRRPGPQWAEPPLRSVLTAAKGSADIRMRLLLAVLFAQSFRVGANGVPARPADWARLVGLPLGGRRAASLRRIGNARNSLQQQGWVQQARGGLITLIDKFSLTPYSSEPAATTERRMRERDSFIATKSESQARYHPRHWEGPPLAVPAELWANGWVGGLSAKSVIAFMIILNHRDSDGMSQVPKIRRHQYALGTDIWTPAIDQLERRKLIRTHNLGTRGAVTNVGYEVIDKTIQGQAPLGQLKAKGVR